LKVRVILLVPKTINYEFKLNNKQKRLARKTDLSYKAKDGAIKILEDVNFDAPKTKEFAAILANLNILDKKSLVVVPESNKNVYLSSRNLKRSKVVTASEVNTYDILNANMVVISEGSISKIEGILRK